VSDAVVEVRDLVKHFPSRRGTDRAGAVHAVDGISFEVARGEALGIVGETGCGKTTTARLLLRLLKPTAGTIRLEGEDITRLSARRLRPLRRRMQMVFQDPQSSLNPRRTVGATIAEPLLVHGLHAGASERDRAVASLLERVGLGPGDRDRLPHELSGGERQRVAIARALAPQPSLLVADEPVSALDVSIQAQILNLLADLRRDLGLSVLLISHDLSVVRHVCDRVAVMYAGKLVEVAETQTLFLHPRHPYTGALLAAVPVADPRVQRRGREPVLAGEPPSPTRPPRACRFHPRCPKAQDVCAEDEPALDLKPGGGVAACHFPLTDAEASEWTSGAARRPDRDGEATAVASPPDRGAGA